MLVKCKHCKLIQELTEWDIKIGFNCEQCQYEEYEELINPDYIIQPIDLSKRRLNVWEVAEKLNEVIEFLATNKKG